MFRTAVVDNQASLQTTTLAGHRTTVDIVQLLEKADKSQLLRSGEQMLKRGYHVATAVAVVHLAVRGQELEHRQSAATDDDVTDEP